MEWGDKDNRRRAELRRMRALATGLLGLMFVVFVAARWGEATYPWLSYARAFAEAAMVGAVADWFAVTALFRRPFGLPIPHTAIVPRNKARIGRSLGGFVANNFLVAEAVSQKLRGVDIAAHLAEWLARPANAHLVSERLSAGVPRVLAALDEAHVRDFLREQAVRGLQSVDPSPVAGRLVSVLVANRHHQVLFDHALDAAGRFLLANEEAIRRKVAEQTAWWVPKWLDEKLFQRIMAGIDSTLGELRDPAHPWRDQFNATAEDLVGKLMTSPDYRVRGEAVRDELLRNPLILRYLDSVWGEIRRRLEADAGAPHSVIRRAVATAVVAVGRHLRDDAEMQAILNRWIEHWVVEHVVPRREAIGAFIAGVVDRWDTPTMVAKLELQVGKDLQYIRVNGTIVGGLVGLAIHLVTRMVG